MSLAYVLSNVIQLYSWVIIIYCLLTWIPFQPNSVLNDIKEFFAKISEPFLDLFKKLMPPLGGMVDVTPIIALVVLQLLAYLIARLPF